MIRFASLPAALLVAFLAASGSASATDLARVTLHREGDLELLLERGFDIVAVHPSAPDLGEAAPPAADLLLKAGEKEQIERLGLQVRVLQADYEAYLAQNLREPAPQFAGGPPGFGSGSMGGYFTFGEMVSLLQQYAATYPSIVSQPISLGTSHEGRPIWALKVSDNPNQDENEPRVLFDALHHAREPMSMHTALWILDHLVANYGADPLVTSLVDEREIWFVPCVNPDGYVYNQQTNPNGGGLWRKNRRNNPGSCDGVDLNRNWPSFWGFDNAGSSGDPCSEVYRGPGPASEPEVQALLQFMAGKNFSIAWSMHTYGEWIVEPYGYKSGNPPGFPEYAEYSADMAAHNHYVAGPGYDLLYPANGVAIDHYHEALGCIAFTPEIGTSFWPPISQAVATASENLEPALLMIEYAGSWLEPGQPALSEIAGDGDGFAEPGETLDVGLLVRNKGQLASGTAQLLLQSATPDVVVVSGSAALAPVPSLSNATLPAGSLAVQVKSGATPGTQADLLLTLQYDGLTATVPIQFGIGQPRAILRDDMESDLGWTAGAPGDNASTGVWERTDPSQKTQDGQVIQPGSDATPPPGTQCYVTDGGGGSAGTGDVDDGKTTLLSPLFDLTGAVAPAVRYQRFYANDDGDDPFSIDISSNGGASWTNLETVIGTQNEWTQVEIPLDALPLTDQMRLRFVAMDEPNNSVTEAAVDEFEVIDFGATPHLGVMGAAKVGGQVELQLATDPGDPFFLFLSLGTGSQQIPGVIGDFGLDPSSLFFLFSAPAAPSGLTRIPIQIPSDGALSGVDAYFQAIVDDPPPTVSNVAHLGIQ